MKTVYISQIDEPSYEKFVDIVNNERPNTIVFLCETEWHSRELTVELAELLNSNTIKLIVTVGSYPNSYYHDLTRPFNNIEIVNWYTHWLNWSVMCSNHLDFNQTYTDFDYPYICLNNKNHIHRCMLVDELTGQGILDKGIVTWNRFPARNPSLYHFKHYNDEVRLISDDFETKLDSFLIPDEYYKSFLHVIGEATTTVPFITEKTCLPILFKKPFIVMADQYFHKRLVDLGFELYDEIIDYTFDSEPDMLKRAEAIAFNVKRITEQNTTELYQIIKEKAQRNYDNYIRIINDAKHIPTVIRDRILELKNNRSIVHNATDGRYVNMYAKMVNNREIIDFNIWNDKTLDNANNLIDNPGNITKIIYNGATEFDSNTIHGSREKFNELVEFAKTHNIEFDLITASAPDNTHIEVDSHVNTYYWPTFWFSMTLTRLLVSPNYWANNSICLDVEDIRVSEKTPIKYPYISMTKLPKLHRAIMMDMLAKHDIINKGVVIWRELTNSYQFEYWDQQIMLRDQVDGFKHQERLPFEYALSFMQVVPETDNTSFGISEKTAMPLFFNKPFLVAGSMNFHKKLEELGFKLYDELFDYSFDSEPDTKIRYDLIAQNVKRYTDKSPQELKELYDSVFEKCVYNKRVILKLATDTKLVPKHWQELANHHILNNILEYPADLLNFIRDNENRFKEI
jgi:hypothetical protein